MSSPTSSIGEVRFFSESPRHGAVACGKFHNAAKPELRGSLGGRRRHFPPVYRADVFGNSRARRSGTYCWVGAGDVADERKALHASSRSTRQQLRPSSASVSGSASALVARTLRGEGDMSFTTKTSREAMRRVMANPLLTLAGEAIREAPPKQIALSGRAPGSSAVGALGCILDAHDYRRCEGLEPGEVVLLSSSPATSCLA